MQGRDINDDGLIGLQNPYVEMYECCENDAVGRVMQQSITLANGLSATFVDGYGCLLSYHI